MFFLRERKGKEKQGPPPPREREREERQTRTNNASNLTHRRLRPLRASEQNTSRKASRSRGKSRSRRRSKAQSTTSYVVRCRSKARSTSTNSKQSMAPIEVQHDAEAKQLGGGTPSCILQGSQALPFFLPRTPPRTLVSTSRRRRPYGCVAAGWLRPPGGPDAPF